MSRDWFRYRISWYFCHHLSFQKAKKKPVEIFPIGEILPEPSDLKPRLEIMEVSDPPPRPPGRKVESVDQLLELLQKEAKVLDLS